MNWDFLEPKGIFMSADIQAEQARDQAYMQKDLEDAFDRVCAYGLFSLDPQRVLEAESDRKLIAWAMGISDHYKRIYGSDQ